MAWSGTAYYGETSNQNSNTIDVDLTFGSTVTPATGDRIGIVAASCAKRIGGSVAPAGVSISQAGYTEEVENSHVESLATSYWGTQVAVYSDTFTNGDDTTPTITFSWTSPAGQATTVSWFLVRGEDGAGTVTTGFGDDAIDFNPPSATTGAGNQDLLVIVLGGAGARNGPTGHSSGPTSYTVDAIAQAGSGANDTDSATLSAYRTVDASTTEDPGAVTWTDGGGSQGDAYACATFLFYTSGGSPQTVNTGTAYRTRNSEATTVTPGALTKTTGTAVRTRTARTLAAVTGGPVTKVTGTAYRTRNAGSAYIRTAFDNTGNVPQVAQGTGTTLTPDMSAETILDGSWVMVAFTVFREGAAPGAITAPAGEGWTQDVANDYYPDGLGNGFRSAIFHKEWGAGGVDDKTPTFTSSNAEFYSHSWIIAKGNVTAAAPTTATGTQDPPSVTTAAGEQQVTAVSMLASVGVFEKHWPVGYTQDTQFQTWGLWTGSAYDGLTATTEDPTSWVYSAPYLDVASVASYLFWFEPQTVNTGTAYRTRVAKSLQAVIGGPTTKVTGTAYRTRTARALAAIDLAITKTTGTAYRTRTARTLAAVTGGPVTKVTGTAYRTRVAKSLAAVTPGPLTKTTGTAYRTRTARALAAIDLAITKTTGTAYRTRVAKTLAAIIGGPTTKTTGTAYRTRVAKAVADVIPGPLTKTTGTAYRTRTAPRVYPFNIDGKRVHVWDAATTRIEAWDAATTRIDYWDAETTRIEAYDSKIELREV